MKKKKKSLLNQEKRPLGILFTVGIAMHWPFIEFQRLNFYNEML